MTSIELQLCDIQGRLFKTAVEIEWLLDVPVREDLYEYIVNE